MDTGSEPILTEEMTIATTAFPAARPSVSNGLRYVPVVDLSQGRVVALSLRRSACAGAGLAALRVACVELAPALRVAGLTTDGPATIAPLGLAAPLSAADLDAPDLVDRLTGMLAEEGLDPSGVTLGIAGAELAARPLTGPAEARLRALSDLGVGIALTGAGRQEGLFALVRDLPLSAVVVDRRIALALGQEREADSLALAVASVAGTFDLAAVAPAAPPAGGVAHLRRLGFSHLLGAGGPF